MVSMSLAWHHGIADLLTKDVPVHVMTNKEYPCTVRSYIYTLQVNDAVF